MKKKYPIEIMTFQVWSYDVWGNAKDGFDVNDRFKQNEIEVTIKPTIYKNNNGDYVEYYPTDLQLNRILGIRGGKWEGDPEYTLYCTDKRNCKPICELERKKVLASY